jgi:hypothetical protein
MEKLPDFSTGIWVLCTISNIGHLPCPIDKTYGQGIVAIKLVIDFMVDIGVLMTPPLCQRLGDINTYMK